ncbi:hypothetical protein V474_01835 [Novosphingobium barchaimii LL02]|uniref:Uncharacterized protein n=1 Tax=Novosphingobium barchaimii LL02 TaxID=1114963 RepID=A0A0J7XJ86_9SPHN|nr:hypothetical protein V474_01835 [Novosphingobium barchaimii LL02]
MKRVTDKPNSSQIHDKPPAHHTMSRRDRSSLNLLRQTGSLLVVQD